MIAAPETKITAGMTRILFCDPRCFLPLYLSALSFRFYLLLGLSKIPATQKTS
jgi:hypothetical protein